MKVVLIKLASFKLFVHPKVDVAMYSACHVTLGSCLSDLAHAEKVFYVTLECDIKIYSCVLFIPSLTGINCANKLVSTMPVGWSCMRF